MKVISIVFFTLCAAMGLLSPLSAQPIDIVDQCGTFKSPDGLVEYTRESSSAPCLERKVIAITDHYLGASWKFENGKMVFSAVPIDEKQGAELNSCLAIATSEPTKEFSAKFITWNSLEECTPGPLAPNYPHRTVRLDMKGATVCVHPGDDACVSLEQLDEKAVENLAKIGVDGVAEALLRAIVPDTSGKNDPI